MKQRISSLALVILMIAGTSAPAEETDGSRGTDHQSFRIIAERNIFDSTRSTRPVAPPAPREAQRRPPAESFSLLGTMIYDNGSYAVFDGSSSQFRGVLAAGETIGGYRIAGISLNHVELEADGQSVELPLGSQMTRQEEGQWTVAARMDADRPGDERPVAARSSDQGGERTSGRRGGTSSSRPAGSTETPRSETARSISAEAESEILKRLMQQRREEELNQ
jgi:hypothetical protein